MTRVTTWVVIGVALYVGIALALSFKVRAPSPVQLLEQALRAAGSSNAVHYQAAWSAGGVSQLVVGDARPASGSETVSVGAQRYTVVYTDHVAYVKGDAVALRDELGLPAATASASGGKWISILPSDRPYPFVEEGLTTSAALAQVLIAPFSTSTVHEGHGAAVTRITGGIPHGQAVTGSAHLDLSRRSSPPCTRPMDPSGARRGRARSPLPTGESASRSNAPVGAIPFSSLQGL